jgi:Na+/proline symporter
MPRQIIDTESSRPRYVRRLVIAWAVAALVVIVLVVLAIAVYGRYRQPAHPQAVPSAAVQPMLSSPKPSGTGPGK